MEYYKNLSLENLTCIDPDGNLVIEQWKDILNYERLYQISTFGRVKGLNRIANGGKYGHQFKLKEKIITPILSSKKYLTVNLCKDGKYKPTLIHRLVATTFIPNPLNKPQVNHKDLIKVHNCEWNLEWNTARENCTHYTTKQKSTSKYTGVYLNKKTGKWKGQISIKNKLIHLGTFLTQEEAHIAYLMAK